ncbi:MAG: hypothetical protein FJ271_07125 [Planctomycetes bacterium]|nr:hypothetical protein [Planctomycetota bacterium]
MSSCKPGMAAPMPVVYVSRSPVESPAVVPTLMVLVAKSTSVNGLKVAGAALAAAPVTVMLPFTSALTSEVV